MYFLENSSAISIQSAGSPDEVLAGQYIANTQEAHTRNNASIPKIVATPAKEQKGMGGYIHPHEKNRGHNSSIPLRQVSHRTVEMQISPKGSSEMFDPALFDSFEGNCSLPLNGRAGRRLPWRCLEYSLNNCPYERQA